MVCVCIVQECRNARKPTRKECNTYCLPKNRALCDHWLVNCARKDLLDKSMETLQRYYRICGDHFPDQMFVSPEREELLPNAVPINFTMAGKIGRKKRYNSKSLAATNISSKNKLTLSGPPPAIPIPLEQLSSSDITNFNFELLNSENERFPSGHITIDHVCSLANVITDNSSSHNSINPLTLPKQEMFTSTTLKCEEGGFPHNYLSMNNSIDEYIVNHDHSYQKSITTRTPSVEKQFTSATLFNDGVEQIPCCSLSLDNSTADVNNKDNSSEKPLMTIRNISELIEQTAASTSRPSAAELKLNMPRNEDDVIEIIEKLKKTNKKNKELMEKCKTLSQLVNNKPDIAEFIASVNNFYLMCDVHLPPKLSTVIKENLKSSNTKYNALRCSDEKKYLAFTVYFYGHLAYKFFRTILQLPNPVILPKYIQNINIMPGLNNFIFEAIKLKIANLKDDAKDCVLCVNKMAIKTHLYYNISKDCILGFINSYKENTFEPAKYVLCFTLQSLNYKWKQHVAYFFINSCTGIHLKNTIFAVISRLQNLSLNIKILKSNALSNFTSFLDLMCVTWDRPYFYVYGKKIYCIFEVPYLLKSTRNIFFKYNFFLFNKKKLIKKTYLDAFYRIDKGLISFAPELSDSHINPGRFQKREVRFARQIFTTPIAVGIGHYIKNGLLPTTAEPTRQFIISMDKLLNLLLNSNNEVGCYTAFNRPFKNTINQKKNLLTMLDLFKDIRVLNTKIINGKITYYDITDKIKFLNGWIITISSILMLWDMPFRPHILHTQILNNNYFKDFYTQFRNINPTPIKFVQTFNKIFFLDFLQCFDGHKSIKDWGKVYTSIVNTFNSGSPFLNFSDKLPLCYNLKVGTLDYRELCLPENNSVHYICGYLLKKCIEKHSCDVCLNYGSFNINRNDCDTMYENFNELTEQFFTYMKILDDIFINNFPILSVGDNFGKKLKKLIDNIPFSHPCCIFEIDYLKTLYIRLRTFHVIKYINKNMLLVNRKNRKIDFISHFKNI